MKFVNSYYDLYYIFFNKYISALKIILVLIGCKHGQVDKKNSSPKMQFTNDIIFYINT
jgi:hypothetical protein